MNQTIRKESLDDDDRRRMERMAHCRPRQLLDSRTWNESKITVNPRKRDMYRQINLAERNVKWGERSIGRGGEGWRKRAKGTDARRREGGCSEEIDVGGVTAREDKSWQV